MSISLPVRAVCMSACALGHVCVEWACVIFPRHSCNWAGLMCNPSRHFKGRKAWTDVVLLVYQMGLYDEKSIIPIQASLPSLVHYKDLHSFFFSRRNNLFFSRAPTPGFFPQHAAPSSSSFSSSISISLSLLLFLPPSVSPASVSLCAPQPCTHTCTLAHTLCS